MNEEPIQQQEIKELTPQEEFERRLAVSRQESQRQVEKTKQYIQKHSRGAARRIVTLSKKAKNESVQLKANESILDRAGVGNNNNTIIPIQINFGNNDEYNE